MKSVIAGSVRLGRPNNETRGNESEIDQVNWFVSAGVVSENWIHALS
jgi:hypothetical protein